jgi:predicted ATPase/class 3 adenylate cyclase/Tfp pilus assembly protein PilF
MIALLMRHDLPSGTVTFLFTDIEGSTRLLHELGAEAYAEALAEHRQAIRGVCSTEGGVEVDTQGDAFFFVFPTAPGALAAASALTEALASGPIQVRIGLHTGTPLLTDEGYVGDDVHRAARIAAAGHGGQVLVTSSTALLVELELRDLGEHRLKDLSAPERVFQLGEGDFPLLKTLHQTNLPIPQTPFLGREKELGEVLGLLERDDVRLLTLTGPGGTGKTRLAAQAAGSVAERFPHGVFWVPLASLRDPALVLENASQVIGAKEGLALHIADKRMLMLFDNFEQVVEAAPDLSDLLGKCPHLELVVTSREPLHLAGEQEYPVPPFAPEEGVGFFLARVRAVKPDFEIDEAVPEICRRLDGLPLALELAASRVKALSTEQILSRLEHRLPLLTGGSRDAPERQRTLRATIDWSYDLLSGEEQRLFRRLSVFAGGCTVEAAEEVCDADVDILQSLVEKSLLRFTGERYWMLETIREFAAERLEESHAAEAIRQRHAEFHVDLAETAATELKGGDQERWWQRLTDEYENMRVALAWVCGESESELALRLTAGLWRYWWTRGHYREGRGWYETALALGEHEPESLRAPALYGLANMALGSGELAEAVTLLERCLESFRGENDNIRVVQTLSDLGIAYGKQGQLDRQQAYTEEALELARSCGDAPGIGTCCINLGFACLGKGELDQATEFFAEALDVFRDANNQQTVALVRENLALTELRRGRLGEASEHLRQSIAASRRTDDKLTLVHSLVVAGAVVAASGDASSAVSVLAGSASLQEEMNLVLDWVEAQVRDETVAGLRDALGDHTYEQAWEVGRQHGYDEILDQALHLLE